MGWCRPGVNNREQAEVPIASATLNLSEAGIARYGHDSRYAQLVLHIEPRDQEGKPAPAANFTGWYDTLVRAQAVPASLRDS